MTLHSSDRQQRAAASGPGASSDPDDEPMILDQVALGVRHDPANQIIYASANPTAQQRQDTLVDTALNNPEWEFVGQTAHRMTPAELRLTVLQISVYLNEPVTERIVRGACAEILRSALTLYE